MEKDLYEDLRVLLMRYQQAPVKIVKRGYYKYVLEASKYAVDTTETRPRELVQTNGFV